MPFELLSVSLVALIEILKANKLINNLTISLDLIIYIS